MHNPAPPGAAPSYETFQTQKPSLLSFGELILSLVHEEEATFAQNTSRGSTGFESYFNLTRPQLRLIFDSLQQAQLTPGSPVAANDGGGETSDRVDYERFRRGLENAGINVRDTKVFDDLVRQVDLDRDGEITFHEFEAVVQSLKLSHLFRTLYSDSLLGYNINIACHDYNVARCETQRDADHDLKRFMFSGKPDWATNRWVHVSTPMPLSSFVLKALAIKYRLHPLALESVLESQTQSLRARIDRYDEHLFVVFPIIGLEEDPCDGNARDGSRSGRSRTRSASALMSRFLKRKPTYSKLASDDASLDPQTPSSPLFNTNESPFRLQESTTPKSSDVPLPKRSFSYGPDSPFPRGSETQFSQGPPSPFLHGQFQDSPCATTMSVNDATQSGSSIRGTRRPSGNQSTRCYVTRGTLSMFVSYPDCSTLITVGHGMDPKILRRATRLLNIPYSRPRGANSMYLLYTMLDVVVDNYAPVVDALGAHVLELRDLLHSETTMPSLFSISKGNSLFYSIYHNLMGEIVTMKRWLLPASRVMQHLLDDHQVEPNLKVYLRDVGDHLEQISDDVAALLDECKSLKEEYEHSFEVKQNGAMAAVTLLATTFLPAQFLTGVFGMNFEGMPELHWTWGYPMFWALCFASWLLIFMYFKYKRFI